MAGHSSNWRIPSPREMRKALVALASLLGVIATLALAQGDVIPESRVKWVTLGLAVLNTVGVFRVPNDRDPGTPAAVADDMSVRDA